ncbi:MAG: FAD-dependent oxidoreductase [Candidatus Curtissbacteria bacterium]|nr:FAD-dependent oxidoreductase [Candidatus Curtissbacteria bacterium]
MNVDFLIIGGSAAGTTAAEVIRGLSPDSTITIIEDEDHEQYSRVLLPHYIRGKVTREQVFLKKPEWYTDKKIDLLKGVKAVKLDPQNHKVVDDKGDEYQYGKLLIAVGGRVIPFEVAGADLANILYMRTVDDADKIINAAKKSQRGVIIGGGFIGLEFASCFKLNGVSDVTILVREKYFWEGKLDEDSSRVLVAVLERNGVKVLTGKEVERFEPSSSHSRLDPEFPDKIDSRFRGNDNSDKRVGAVVTKSGKRLDAQVVGIGVGIRPNLEWLEGSGIEIGRAIKTNEYLETNLPDVFAAGDCAEFNDVIFERQHVLGNWANATNQGNIVGKNMGGQRTIFETASSYSINFFDGACSFMGVTEADFADEVVPRGSVEAGKMTQIYIKTIGGVMRIVGATIINNPMEVSPLTAAIKSKTDISANKDKLDDPSFDLKDLVINS